MKPYQTALLGAYETESTEKNRSSMNVYLYRVNERSAKKKLALPGFTLDAPSSRITWDDHKLVKPVSGQYFCHRSRAWLDILRVHPYCRLEILWQHVSRTKSRKYEWGANQFADTIATYSWWHRVRIKFQSASERYVGRKTFVNREISFYLPG